MLLAVVCATLSILGLTRVAYNAVHPQIPVVEAEEVPVAQFVRGPGDEEALEVAAEAVPNEIAFIDTTAQVI